MQTLQAAETGAKNIAAVTDVTKEKRKYETGDSEENIGKEQAQGSDDKAANQRSGDKTVTPNKETKDQELKRPVRVYFST